MTTDFSSPDLPPIPTLEELADKLTAVRFARDAFSVPSVAFRFLEAWAKGEDVSYWLKELEEDRAAALED
ncbi:hypothetical protein [Aminobacter sp. DSM 101952]|uniref:hypothetical protein n=1 Tax=Aminobacter sp. DSM 101952 TaxID=2735891 RepID=UPI0012E3A1F1|nr:hypothetical protein [Aminobacter sp. DSM 101952]